MKAMDSGGNKFSSKFFEGHPYQQTPEECKMAKMLWRQQQQKQGD